MMRRFTAIFDAFLLALAATVAIAALLPAHGHAAGIVVARRQIQLVVCATIASRLGRRADAAEVRE